MPTSVPSEHAVASAAPGGAVPRGSKTADVGHERISRIAQDVTNWIVSSGNNNNMPFIVVDKVDAKIFVFDKNSEFLGAASALLGLAHGDDSVPGIGERKLSTIRPEERTTPAGRFVASLDTNLHGQEILWVDYDTAISLHAVVAGSPKERRAERLASPTPSDNRISYGCINVPVSFFQKIVSPVFSRTDGVVYVLPETRLARETFSVYGYQPE